MMMPKQKYWLFGILILSVIGIILISGCVQKEGEKVETEPSTEVQVYKGIWLPGINPNYLASHIQEMKDMGMNTVSLGVGFIEEDGNRLAGIDTSQIVEDIQTAHENGLKVMLNPQFHPQPKLKDLDVEELNSKIVEVAKLAEENDVELFAPLGEADVIFHPNTGKWRQEILPKIKEVYHGEIFWSGPGVGLPDKTTISKIPEQPPGDFSGYDYIGFTTLFTPSERLTPEERLQYADMLTLEGYSQYVEGALDYMLALAERDNCKGVIIKEFGVGDRFFMTESGVVDLLDMGLWSEEELARASEIVFEKGKDRVVGFIAANFLGGEVPGMPGVYIKGVSKTEEEVIRKWFTEIL